MNGNGEGIVFQGDSAGYDAYLRNRLNDRYWNVEIGDNEIPIERQEVLYNTTTQLDTDNNQESEDGKETQQRFDRYDRERMLSSLCQKREPSEYVQPVKKDDVITGSSLNILV